ncbi:endonuclease YncB(thermonuclease family) [Pontibacter aydingkolensis]|uniref:Thermonuclease family protein n=1 Tax=Pontibacter aydingkolensis TaxID=1911536 RepID=A0ABS7CZQ0_9BACT|nr:thermonuclease family protein [Pontibacter aydingkolensis]MBW7469292.1 thermonuclease family protein [Pontibacter aydingkolensis]
MSKLFLHTILFLSLGLFSACNQNEDRQRAREDFRQRQQPVPDRDVVEQQEDIATAEYEDPAEAAERERTPSEPATTAGDKVVGVKDGDTIVLLVNGEEVTVRLYGVDTPEKNQAFGQRAKQFTSDMVFGKQVRLIVNNKDRYGRTVGTIILPDGRSLNEELVKNGFAWHYKAYSKDVNLANAEADARRFKRGLWADPDPVAPWDFRKNKTSNTSATSSTAKATLPAGATKRTVYLCNSSGSAVYHIDKSCSVLKRCKAEVLTVTEAVAIREYGRRADKTCSN